MSGTFFLLPDLEDLLIASIKPKRSSKKSKRSEKIKKRKSLKR
jgi:hypothetical protein